MKKRNQRRYRCHHKIANDTCKEFLEKVWQLDWDPTVTHDGIPPDPYVEHWINCVVEADDADLELHDHKVAVHLVEVLKQNLDTEVAKLVQIICQTYPTTSANSMVVSEAQAVVALRFASSLYLHFIPSLSNTVPASIRGLLKDSLPPRSNPTTISGQLTEDFCAKHLWRKGGIKILWTNELDKHLTCLRREAVYVFRHSSVLRSQQCDPAR